MSGGPASTQLLAVCSLLVPALGGAVAVGALRKKAQECLPLALCVPLGALLGVGVASLGQFVWLHVRGQVSDGIIWLDLFWLAAGAMAWGIARWRRSVAQSPRLPRFRPLDWLLHLVVLAAVLGAGARLWGLFMKSGHGSWDAWAIWNLRARFLFRAGAQWTSAFSPVIGYSHPDYPLLLPLTVVRGWAWTGVETTLVPQLVSGFFTAGLVAVVYGALRALRGWRAAVFASAVVLVTPVVILNATIQYADLPVGVFLFSGLALLMLADRHAALRRRLLVLSGLAFGMAAWTKNEGLLFIVAACAAQALVLLRSGGRQAAVRRLLHFAFGLAPVLIVLAFFKLSLATTSDLTALQEPGRVLRSLSDPGRYATILRSVGELATSDSGLWFLPLTLLVAAGLLGVRVPGAERTGWVTAACTLPLICAGFFIVYLLTPYDLTWHLNSSLDRLLLQLWPSFVLLLFTAVRAEALGAPELAAQPGSP